MEVNYSFYRIPAEDTVAEWLGTTPASTRFAFKMWRGVTHYRKLKNCGEFLQSFFEVVDAVPARRRGPVLVQLPPNQRVQPTCLRFASASG